MSDKSLKKLDHILWKDVNITGGFWKPRQEINRKVTLPAEYKQCKDTGRIDSIKLIYSRDKTDVPQPHHYWDSDVAKWIEAVAFSLVQQPDAELEEIVDKIVDDFEKAQHSDGYLNTYFTVVEPGKRWTNVFVMHELYCAGHLIEAAVAYYLATGKRKFLNILCRYADHIDSVFGPEEGKIHGYPGHQELELALIKLYRVTDEERYLKLSKYFLDERGKQPYFFEQETLERGADPEHSERKEILNKNYLAAGAYALFQSHLPVREQKTAEGHAVRVMYMCSAMADVAAETGDTTLVDACNTLWDNVTLRRMYITGGVGPQDISERFAFDYHLPNETAYNETCASIGLVMWAHRMLQLGADSKYGDIMEQTLYNGVISGVSLTGDRFFYANHLASHPGLYENRIIRNPRMFPERQQWFEVSCCPPNIARLTESIGGYIYSTKADEVYVHLYIQSDVKARLANGNVSISQITNYPFDEKIKLLINPENPGNFTVSVRIPWWCRHAQVKVNGEAADGYASLEKGYLKISRNWKQGDEISMDLPMEVMLMESHPSVRVNCGQVAIKYGPIVYCLEETDNGKDLFDITLTPDSKFFVEYDPDLLGGVKYIKASAKRRERSQWENQLYKLAGSEYIDCEIKAIPYYAWSNRETGEMTVWIRYNECSC